MKKKAIINAIVYDYHDFHEHGYVVFDETIIEKGSMEDFIDRGYEIIDGKDTMLMPSMIVGHTHVYSTFARGWLNDFEYNDFMDILEGQWWRLDKRLTRDSIFYSGIVNAVDHLKNGVTTIIDHHASGTIKDSLATLKEAMTDTVGVRGCYAFETSDRFDVDACIAENRAFMQTKSTMHQGLFGLHASLTLSEETLKKVKANLGDAPIHIHVAEDKMDEDDCVEKYGERVIERLDRHGLLNAGSIITHALYIDENEADILKKRQCVVALNPGSNMNNGIDVPNYALLRRKGIPVIIGNDGLSSSVTTEYLNLFFTQHVKENTPEAFGLDDLERIIKDTYAYASDRFGIRLGKLSPGYEADMLMLPYIPPTPIHKANALGHLFFGAFSSFKPSHVFIGGRQLVSNYTIDRSAETLYRQARSRAETVWHTIEKEVGDSK